MSLAPLQVLPSLLNLSIPIPFVEINITLNADITGTLNVCTGQLQMLFNVSTYDDCLLTQHSLGLESQPCCHPDHPFVERLQRPSLRSK